MGIEATITTIMANNQVFGLLILPTFIFLAKVGDVTFGTLRTVVMSRGMKYMATGLGFFEILIWLLAIGQIFQNLNAVENYIAYATGYAAGHLLGLYIEERVAFGYLSVTIITGTDARDLVTQLKERSFNITSVNATGRLGTVRLILTIIKRKHLTSLQQLVRQTHPNAFISIQEVRSINREPYTESEVQQRSLSPFHRLRIKHK